jgi:hypothetical protein
MKTVTAYYYSGSGIFYLNKEPPLTWFTTKADLLRYLDGQGFTHYQIRHVKPVNRGGKFIENPDIPVEKLRRIPKKYRNKEVR